MVATITRRVILRPEIDEPCPEWALPLLPLSSEADPHGVGVANERVPQETAMVLNDLFPAPPKPARDRKRDASERRYKPYIRAWAAAVYFALLPYALAKQVSLFTGREEKLADVAVLCFRRLSDLAPKLGISYDRLQKWMTVLLVLGFVHRFRDGRNVFYILPLTAYVPSPSPEAVLSKLNKLIASQFVEATLPDGRTVWCDRCPEWTAQLIAIRTRFAARYQLPLVIVDEQELSSPVTAEQPRLSQSRAVEGSSDQAFQAMLHEVSEAIPEEVRPELMLRLLPILARSYASIISLSGDRPLSDREAGAAGRSNLDITMAQRGNAGDTRRTESRYGRRGVEWNK